LLSKVTHAEGLFVMEVSGNPVPECMNYSCSLPLI